MVPFMIPPEAIYFAILAEALLVFIALWDRLGRATVPITLVWVLAADTNMRITHNFTNKALLAITSIDWYWLIRRNPNWQLLWYYLPLGLLTLFMVWIIWESRKLPKITKKKETLSADQNVVKM